jgi:hypothetical protein
MSQAAISVLDVKNALKDENFRNNLPSSLNEDVQKFLQNPNCSCNLKVYQKIMAEAKDQIAAYYPDKLYKSPEETAKAVSKNTFRVINCSIGELEAKMQQLPVGRKQITLARWEDQVTVLINELEISF